MKTNKINKMIIAILAAVMFFSLTAAAFADNAAKTDSEAVQAKTPEAKPVNTVPECPTRGNDSGKGRRQNPFDKDSLEDWFEDRIEKFGKQVDFSRLPENPTFEQIIEFFKNSFRDETAAQQNGEASAPDAVQAETPEIEAGRNNHGKGSGKSRSSKPFDEDSLEDWFEDRIEKHGKKVDFSRLPENPTDEEIIEFFKQNYLDKGTAQQTGAEITPDTVQAETPETDTGRNKHGKGSGNCRHHKPFDEDDFEDWFEDCIEKHGKHVDFSQLPENPTDEEIVEFFKQNFTGKGNAQRNSVDDVNDDDDDRNDNDDHNDDGDDVREQHHQDRPHHRHTATPETPEADPQAAPTEKSPEEPRETA